jgi:Mn2+/Fe2+ NRAMP family transporter
MLRIKKLFKTLGPGVITGASDDDPSGVVTYSQTGAQYGYRFLWLSFFTTPLMMAVQEMSARIGLVTRQGLGKVIRRHVSRRVAIVLALGLLVVNTINISADLNAMAEVMRLIVPGNAVAFLFGFAILILILEVTVSYARYANILKWLTMTLFSYVIVVFVTRQDWSAIAWHTFIPTLTGGRESWYLITAILGTTISPYLFFWQASEEVEEENLLEKMKERVQLNSEIRSMRRDTMIGMLFSNVIMFFIIVATAGTLHQAGITNITSAEQAASALQPLAGSLAFTLFAVGILGTGLLAIPVLAGSAAYAVAEVFQWPEGLGKKFRDAKAFYIVIGVAIIGGAIATIAGTNPIHFLILAAVLNGLLAPIMLWFIIRLASNPNVMGGHISPTVVHRIGWVTFALMSISGLLTIAQIF